MTYDLSKLMQYMLVVYYIIEDDFGTASTKMNENVLKRNM